MNMKTKTHLLKVNQVDIYCTVKGEESPILLVHGAGCDSDFFENCANTFVKNYKVITYDRRGYSRNNGIIKKEFLETNANDIREILSQLISNEKSYK